MKNKYFKLFGCLYLIFTFGTLDLWLRVLTRRIGWYSIYGIAPNLFTLCWSAIIVLLLLCIPNIRMRKFLYGFMYFAWMIYVIVQYGTYMILDKFLFLSDFLLAQEGMDYTSYVVEFISVGLILQIFALICIGSVGILIIGKISVILPMKFVLGGGIMAGFIMLFIPRLYGDELGWASRSYEYEKFTTATRDIEMTGIYQFVFHDAYLQVQKKTKNYDEEYEKIDAYFKEQKESKSNGMTNVFEGKNVIVVMMESLDDWIINSEDTPTIEWMMKNGINFTEMYTPYYSNGYTFNTEFAFNTGVYPYSNGNAAYSLSKNVLTYSLPNLFKEAGYSVNSFHAGTKDFYNRGEIHEGFGYEAYHSYHDYQAEDVSVRNDMFLTKSDELWSDVTGRGEKFMSFVITFSPHLPYEADDELAIYAASQHPEYDKENLTEEECIRAKARLTDDMFAEMLSRLDKDGILKNTVIVAFSDHYSYGLENKELLQRLSEEAGNSILENTPAFIYCADYDEPTVVDKTMQITDFGPTIANLFGLRNMDRVMGHDIFDESYEGVVIFPDNTWLTSKAYMKNGVMVWNNGMTRKEIDEMNEKVIQKYEINDLILESDYYAYQHKGE